MFLLYIIAGIIIAWVILAQFIMTRRISDGRAMRIFEAAGISLTTAYTDVNGFRLHYVKTGQDALPTLFLVHGTPGSWKRWKRYLMDRDLLLHYRIVAVDRPGFGYSEFGKGKNLQEQSVIISALIKELENGMPFFILGHSFGGPLTLRMAADDPALFSSIALSAPALNPRFEKIFLLQPALFHPVIKLFIPGALKANVEELYYLKEDLKMLSNDLSRITCPVTILHGEKDGLVPVSNAWYGKEKLVNAKKVSICIIPKVGHSIPDTRFEIFKETLLSLSENKG